MTDRNHMPDDEPSSARSRWNLRRKWPLVVILSALLIPGLLVGLWSFIALSYTYSTGYRTGYIQKLSEKGWVCKTWEGELAMVNVPGALQERFEFTVRSDSVAAEINGLQGRRVKLHYREHKGVPLSCFGETKYFVDGVQTVDEMGTVGAPPVVTPQQPSPAPPVGTPQQASPAPPGPPASPAPRSP